MFHQDITSQYTVLRLLHLIFSSIPAAKVGRKEFIKQIKGKEDQVNEVNSSKNAIIIQRNSQSNKTADAVALFDCIQTVDREKIAKTIAAEMQKQNKKDHHLISRCSKEINNQWLYSVTQECFKRFLFDYFNWK